MRSISRLATLLLLCLPAAAAGAKAKNAKPSAWARQPGLYAKFETTQGTFVCRLFEKQSPKTVSNFVGLATGSKEYADAKTGDRKKAPFYDGGSFNRIVPGYLIQGGDPNGDATGGPGYVFDDEINGLKFNAPGLLAMANYGPNTNGSQFFVTDVAAEALNDVKDAKGDLATHFTIFGKVVDGQPVVDAISRLPTLAGGDQPAQPSVLNKVTVLRVDSKKKMKAVKG